MRARSRMLRRSAVVKSCPGPHGSVWWPSVAPRRVVLQNEPWVATRRLPDYDVLRLRGTYMWNCSASLFPHLWATQKRPSRPYPESQRYNEDLCTEYRVKIHVFALIPAHEVLGNGLRSIWMVIIEPSDR